MDWTLEDLIKWEKKISKIARNYGLDWFDIDYEICDYHDMIGNMSYVGMPSHYNHWSFGKEFERIHQMYNLGMEGLPYEMIINSDPSIAYLMKENPLPMHILTMAHCVGHSDFFKNNITFSDTDPKNIITRIKRSGERIRNYCEDPSIGIERVEKILDAAHSIKYHCNYYRTKKLSNDEIIKRYNASLLKNDDVEPIDINRIPLEPDFNILEFIKNHGRYLDSWEKDILEIVINDANYFIPQIRTKIMNEGWASFWHYKILNELDLPQEYHLYFIRSHNQVIRPILGSLNPYHLGFLIFKKLEEKDGLDACFEARESLNDESFIRMYLDEDLCMEINLFSYSLKKKSDNFTIDEISDEDGWKSVKNDLIMNIAMNNMPKIYIDELDKKTNTISLKHDHDGRDIELDDAQKVFDHIQSMWRDPVKFTTIIEDEKWEFPVT